MYGIPQRIETGKHIQRNRWVGMPAIVLGYRHKFRPRARAIDADAKRIWTKMPPSREAIAAVSTGDVSLADHEIAASKSFHVVTDNTHDTGKLVTDGHRHRNGFLRPVVPVVDVHVCTTDRRLQHPDQHVIAANFWNRNILEPKTGLCFCFDYRLHRRLHDSKLGEAEKREKVFARAEAASCALKAKALCLIFQNPHRRRSFLIDMIPAILAQRFSSRDVNF